MAQMLLSQSGKLKIFPQHKIRARKDLSAKLYPNKRQIIIASQRDVDIIKQDCNTQESIGRIREMFGKIDLSVSSYDTAWVAMVPANGGSLNHHQPSFPTCLEWIMENQKADGSWGLNPSHPSLIKDSLSSTLACVLALQKWKVGEQLVQKGLDFIGSNSFAVSNDKHQSSPLGFDILFSGMINLANGMGLNLPLDSTFIDLMLRNRDLELQSFKGKEGCLAYFAEGLGKSCNWKEVMKKQWRNGSIFNSPATTAAAFIHFHDDKCFDYLQSLMKVHTKAVPTIYPCDIYTRLCLVDTIDRLGINRHFGYEIKIVLDQTHKCWKQRSEDIFSDVSCCVLAFRLLRMNGYEVSSDALEEFADQDHFFNTVSPQFTNTETIIQLYRASQIPIFQNEPILDKINVWTSTFLRHQLLNQDISDERLQKEVEYAFDYPIDNLDRLTHRRGIELYSTNNNRMLKTSYRCLNIDNGDLLLFSQHDFNKCQAIHLEELQQLEKWVKESRVGGLNFKWHILVSSYFQLAALHFSPELSDTRIAWTQNSFIGTIIDDLFDVDGSREELLNLIELLENWDGQSNISAVGYSSERVEIAFLCLTEIINVQAAKGLIKQGRCIKHELLEIWRNFLKCSYKEVEWWTCKSTPTLEEYLTNGHISVGVGIYSINFYFLGPKLSPDLFKSDAYITLFKHAGIIGRVFNDYQGVLELDKAQRKMNSCSLIISHSNEDITVEEARAEARRMIESSRREELRTMVQTKPTAIPKELIESFFNLNKICYYLYNKNDEYRSPERTFDDINALLYDPIDLMSSVPEEKISKAFVLM